MSEKRANYTTRRFYDPLDDLLDRPIAFNPAFKKITGSTVAATTCQTKSDVIGAAANVY